MNHIFIKKTNFFFGVVAILFASYLMNACASNPKNATAVSDFEVDKYLGEWFEIARKDFKFEKNLNNVTAHYSLLDDGKIKVLNKGFDTVKQEWTEAEGKAKFRSEKNVAELAVSFFGPFYSGYNVIAIDREYKYALVAGKNLDYLWLLSREKTMPDGVKDSFLEKAKSVGYDVSDLVWVKHD